MTQQMINKLRAQADALELQMASAKAVPAGITRADISRMVADEMSRLTQSVVAPVLTAKPAEPSILSLMGQAYTQEQQLWISANVKEIPAFIASENGKAALGMMLEEFQTYIKENAPG